MSNSRQRAQTIKETKKIIRKMFMRNWEEKGEQGREQCDVKERPGLKSKGKVKVEFLRARASKRAPPHTEKRYVNLKQWGEILGHGELREGQTKALND